MTDETPKPHNETPKTVTVRASQLHTYDGKSYDVGDIYEIEAQYADSVAAQGKAVRVDPPAAAPAKPASHPVTPLGTGDVPVGTPKA